MKVNIMEIYESMEYGPAPESQEMVLNWLKKYNNKFELFIGGRWVKPKTPKYLESINPSNGKKIADYAQAAKVDIDKAVKIASDAQKKWWSIGAHKRSQYIYALARQIQKNARLFAVLETMDNGKPIRETRDIDIPVVARHFYAHAGWAQLMETEFPDYEPVGVVGAICPWNFPLMMLAWKIGPALAMGNTVVFKPARYTVMSALLFAEICQIVGIPPGVVNILTGNSEVGKVFVNHPDINKIAFTGSTEVGRWIRRATAGSGKEITLELGGKSPFIAFEDADLDSVVEGIVDAIWFNQGQVCCAGSRLLVQENIEDRLISKIKARMETLRVGDPLDKTTDIGAINNEPQLETIKKYVDIGQKEGGVVWQPSTKCPTDGFFYPPTLFTETHPSSTVSQEEIFGPVLVTHTFRTPEEAVQLANNTRFGLAASIWTENINLALDIAPKIKAGTIWINCTNLFDASSGFGGYRESGFGREGGKEGLWSYIKPKWESIEEKKTKKKETEKEKPLEDLGESVDEDENIEISFPNIDRTTKMFIGGKQIRPDQNYNIIINNPTGDYVGEVGQGNRKDIRKAVEAAHKTSWAKTNGHTRAQILYYIAENLAQRSLEFASRIEKMTGKTLNEASEEVKLSIERIFYYAAYADKYDGAVHQTLVRYVTQAMNEPIGVMGIICPREEPLLGFISTIIPAIAMGNSVVAVPSSEFPLSATDFYQILETSDLPAGVINIVTGDQLQLAEILANHDDIESIWYFGPENNGRKMIENASAGNMKRTWANYGKKRNWFITEEGQGLEFLRESTHVKNIWIPYGE
jgi:aldehyde dehydrogenase (NAD+)